jgi:UDP-N-acetylmuramoylalanine--D-glutamate ligase
MKIAILGYARQGQSAAEYFSKNTANEITICDIKENLKLPKTFKKKLGKNYLKNLNDFDLIVRSPSIHPKNIIAENNAEITEKITTTTNIFFEVCPTKNIIGVTGTKGKGTTSTLISRILENDGFRVHLGGNIGLDPLQLLKENIKPTDWVVLELANFQLIDIKHSPKIAVCLTFTPEHLDWHTDTAEYLKAKQQLFKWQKKDDIAIYYSANDYSKKIAEASGGKIIPFLQKPGAIVENDTVKIDDHTICQKEDIKLIGDHNLQNVCAAVTAVWQITQDTDSIKNAIKDFSGLPHRIEFVREVNGIAFYNDSFATAQGATIAAINAIKENKILILGGYDRGMDLNEIIEEIKLHNKDISHFVLIGSTANILKRELSANKLSNYTVIESKKMTDIVKTANRLAKPGEAVIFSPAFASFDMFKDFEDRGNQFKDQVLAL